MRHKVSEPALTRLGVELGGALPMGSVVWLTGELGAGKTTLVAALVEGLGGAGGVSSPTYDLVHRYETIAGPVFHVDCYRLRSPDEAAELDWENLIAGRALLVEWPERAGPWAPPPDRTVSLEHTDEEGSRWIDLQ